MSELGKLLRQQRENRGLSLQEVGLSLKISSRILTGIETGNRSVLPPRTFLRGFVRSYAIHLGLEEEKTMELFAHEYGDSLSNNMVKGMQITPPKKIEIEPEKKIEYKTTTKNVPIMPPDQAPLSNAIDSSVVTTPLVQPKSPSKMSKATAPERPKLDPSPKREDVIAEPNNERVESEKVKQVESKSAAPKLVAVNNENLGKSAKEKMAGVSPPKDENKFKTLLGSIAMVFVIVSVFKIVTKYQREKNINRGTLINAKSQIAAKDVKLDEIGAALVAPPTNMTDSNLSNKAPELVVKKNESTSAPIQATSVGTVAPVLPGPNNSATVPPGQNTGAQNTGAPNKVAPNTVAPVTPPLPINPQPHSQTSPPTQAPPSQPSSSAEKKVEEKKIEDKKQDEKKQIEETLAVTGDTEKPANTAEANKIPSRVTEIIVEATDSVELVFQNSKKAKQKVALSKGEFYTFKSKDPVVLEVSNGGAASVIINGQDRGPIGKSGQPFKLNLPEQ